MNRLSTCLPTASAQLLLPGAGDLVFRVNFRLGSPYNLALPLVPWGLAIKWNEGASD